MLDVIFDKFTEICQEQNIKLNLTSLAVSLTALQFESLITSKYSKTMKLHCWFHVKNAIMKDVEKLKTLSDLVILDLLIKLAVDLASFLNLKQKNQRQIQ